MEKATTRTNYISHPGYTFESAYVWIIQIYSICKLCKYKFTHNANLLTLYKFLSIAIKNKCYVRMNLQSHTDSNLCNYVNRLRICMHLQRIWTRENSKNARNVQNIKSSMLIIIFSIEKKFFWLLDRVCKNLKFQFTKIFIHKHLLGV